MNRIDAKFEELRKAGRKGLVGYMTAGYPDRVRSLADIREVLANGVDVLELGVPFSDPTADGPTIQASSLQALAAGMTLRGVLEMVAEIRVESQVPLVLFGYANPLFRYGYEKLCRDAVAAGVDGLLVVDLPFEERGELVPFAKASGLHVVPLIAPTTPKARAAEILRDAGGFVYYIMVTGVTGARASVASDVGAHIAALREATRLPIAAGFGVSNGEQAGEAGRHADAVVVGSALLQASARGALGALVRDLRRGLDG